MTTPLHPHPELDALLRKMDKVVNDAAVVAARIEARRSIEIPTRDIYREIARMQKEQA